RPSHSSTFFPLRLPPPPRSTLFPYTTLFRSDQLRRIGSALADEITTVEPLPDDSFQLAEKMQPRLFAGIAPLLHHQMRRQMVERSEEHTSELQSRGHLVCRLLLEKKKKSRLH